VSLETYFCINKVLPATALQITKPVCSIALEHQFYLLPRFLVPFRLRHIFVYLFYLCPSLCPS